MPIVKCSFEFDGRPMIELYVGRPSADAEIRSPCPPIPISALVDTGAATTMIQQWVFDQLELWPVGQQLIHTASTGGNPVTADVYAIDISLAGEETGLLASNLKVLSAKELSGLGVQALLGRDILGRGLLIYDGLERRFTLAIEPPKVWTY